MSQKRPNIKCNIAQIQIPYSFTIQSLDECHHAARTIHDLFKHYTTKDIETGCHELLVNAIEHGNLEITLDQKMALIQSGELLTFLKKRLAEDPYKNRRVWVNCEIGSFHDKESLIITIKDEGQGFDWKRQIEISEKKCLASQVHGRGILIAKELSFDHLHYNNVGNQVTGISYIE